MEAQLMSRLVSWGGCAGVLLGALAVACSPGGSAGESMTPSPLNMAGGMPSPSPAPAPQTARYHVTFDASWSGTTHPQDFPSDPHFSPLVGATHDTSVAFWRPGMLATQGIKDMAERGRTAPLVAEVDAAIAAGTAERSFVGGNVPVSPGAAVVEFDISQRYPLVTLVSMVAPSPDWFVGVADLSLFSAGQWVEEREIPLVPWDAGTDSGPTFTSPDEVTVPQQPVFAIVSAPLSPGGQVTPMGRFVFRRIG
jgi:hypothetical protein